MLVNVSTARQSAQAPIAALRSARRLTCSQVNSGRLRPKRPIFRKTAAYGHFGRNLPEFTWEQVSRLADFKAAIGA